MIGSETLRMGPIFGETALPYVKAELTQVIDNGRRYTLSSI